MTLILMSTYQGEKYLPAQLDSIIAQTFKDWILLIRDDGSIDNTLAIIEEYSQKDSRIQLIKDDLGNLKPAQSFSALMEHALKRDEPFIFFADQDDVWLPHKLTLGVETLKKNHLPTLVFSDLCVVDENLTVIHPSYLQYEKLKPQKKDPLKTLLLHNYITGCALGMNRALLNLACPVPPSALMHDWWCALNAASSGKIEYIDQVTLFYRQHSKNDTGSKGFYHKFKNIKQIKKLKASLKNRMQQADSLLERIESTNPNKTLISTFSRLVESNRLSRLFKLSQLGLKSDGYIRKWGFLFLLMM